VALGGADEGLLARLAQAAQGMGERRADGPLVDLALDGGGEPGSQGQPAHDPGLAPAEERGDARQAEPVVVEQGADDAPLVHGRCRARRGVGAQQQELLLDRRAGAVDDGRHRGPSLVGPAGEPLEAVDDLEAAVAGGDDADGKIPELGRGVAARVSTAQPREARAQECDGDLAHERVGRHGIAPDCDHRDDRHGRAR
jgi:hypothetical protein